MHGRLRRLDRVFERNPIFFVTTCIHDRRPILARPEMHTELEMFAAAGPAHGAWLGAYVLMPNHLHAFVSLDDERLGLSKWMRLLKNALAKKLREVGFESPHWQSGFFDHVMRSGE